MTAQCVNEGLDRRMFRWLTCRVQPLVSFRSHRPPRRILETGSVFIGWPPVIAVNVRHDSDSPDARGGHKFLHLRLGYRWDAHPKQEPELGGHYILSAALKDLPHKQQFWRDREVGKSWDGGGQ